MEKRGEDTTLTTSIDSIEGMKARLPVLRERLKTDPAYFKKVYMHTFDLIKTPGSRVLQLDTGESILLYQQ